MLRGVCVLAAAAAVLSAPAQAQTYVTFAFSGAEWTTAAGINNDGVVAGTYEDGQPAGFVRATDGTLTTFSTGSSHGSFTVGIDRNGTVVGTSVGVTSYDGFIRTSDGTLTLFDTRHSLSTQVTAVNGSTIGISQRPGFPSHTDGFQRLRRGRTYEFRCAGVPAISPLAINGLGVIAGSFHYHAKANHFHVKYHSFVRGTDGSCTFFDPPGALQSSAVGINDAGTITGNYQDAARTKLGPPHGFVRAADGTITPFDVPGAEETDPVAINNAGTIIGTYVDGQRLTHAFLRTADGTITTFDAPGATDTVATGINDSGVIVGYYDSPGNGGTAFIRTP